MPIGRLRFFAVQLRPGQVAAVFQGGMHRRQVWAVTQPVEKVAEALHDRPFGDARQVGQAFEINLRRDIPEDSEDVIKTVGATRIPQNVERCESW